MKNKLLLHNRIFLFIVLPTAFFFIFPILSSVSASSNTLNFQSKIVNLVDGTNIDTGTPACVVAGNGNDTCDFRVNIYDDPTAGNLLFSEDHINTEIGHYNGIFNLEINSVCNVVSDTGTDGNWTDVADPCISNGGVDFSATDLWIEIEFDPTGTSTFSETFSRVEIRDVASARYAVSASNISGFTEGDFVWFKPNIVQTTTSTNTLINLETTANTANPLLVFNENGAGTPDLLRLQNTGNSVFTVANDGRVGVFVAPTADTALRIESALQSTYTAGNYDPLTVITTNDTTGGRTYGVRSVINTGATNAPGSLRAIRGEILYSTSGTAAGFMTPISGFINVTGGTLTGTAVGLSSTSRNTSGTVATLQSINSFAENLVGGTVATHQNGYFNHSNAGTVTGRMANHSLFTQNSSTVGDHFVGMESFLINTVAGSISNGMQNLALATGNSGTVATDLFGIRNEVNNEATGVANQSVFGIRTQIINDGTILGDMIGYDYAIFGAGSVTGNTYGYRGVDSYSTVILNDFTNSLSISTSGDIALNGNQILTTNAGTIDMFPNNVTTINFGRTGANGTLNLMGGDTDTGCTINGVTGDLTCTGTIAGSVSGAFFEDGGNSFGATAVLGTNDTEELQIITDGTLALTIQTNQDIFTSQQLNVGTSLTVNQYSGFGTGATGSAYGTFASADNATASINIQNSFGSDPGAPNDGDLWWNGNELYFFDGTSNLDLLGGACANCFVDGGNSFGTTAVIGTIDTNELQFMVDSLIAMGIQTDLRVYTNADFLVYGYAGFGGISPTSSAWLSIEAPNGGTSSINFGSGGDPGAPNNGDLWYNGTELYFYDGGTTHNLLSGNAFVEGGNSFGANAFLGTTDNFGLEFIVNNSTAMFFDSAGNGTFQYDLTAEDDVFFTNLQAPASGTVGVCVDTTTFQLFYGASSTDCDPSSARFKHNIQNLNTELGLDALRALRPVTYTYNDRNIDSLGFIAEEVAEIDERLIVRDSEGLISAINSNRLLPIIVKGVQEMDARLISLEERVEDIGITVDSQTVTLSQVGDALNSHAANLLTLADADQNQMNLYNILSDRVLALENSVAGIDSRIAALEGASGSIDPNNFEVNIAKINERLVVGGNTAGTTTILENTNEVEFTFPTAYMGTPIVTVSPLDFNLPYRLFEVTPAGFKIQLDNVTLVPITFNWIALGK